MASHEDAATASVWALDLVIVRVRKPEEADPLPASSSPGTLPLRLTGRSGPLDPYRQHSRIARCAGARCHCSAGTGTFHPGVLMSSRLQSLRRQAFQRQGGRCYYCGVRMWLSSPGELPGPPRSEGATAKLRCTAEHLLPQADGGRDTLSNIAAACAHCNHTRHKRKRPPEPAVYRREIRRRVLRRRWHHRWVFEVGLVGWPCRQAAESELSLAAVNDRVVRCLWATAPQL